MYSEGTKRYVASEFAKGDCIVAFLDILGFEELVQTSVYSKDPLAKKRMIETIKSALKDALKNIETGENKDLNLIKYKVFSDCTCLATPSFHNRDNEASNLCTLITMIKGYTFNLIRRNIYIRGGISRGYHYEDNYMIFSDGLVKAHNLENKEALYPRTILDEDLVQRFKRLWINQKDAILEFNVQTRLITDEEGITFVSPFNLMQSMDKQTLVDTSAPRSKKDLIKIDNNFNREILKDVEEKIIKYKDNERVLPKYEWLKEFINWNIKPKSSKYKFEYLLK
ncbi:hypothetical protein [Methanobacterium sp. MBAC-LM]|uniref:hypothetical protein n=1 Tax=Methanobacterium sp. MBAC-LM TaxID=3412034 RepID=UPI003C70F593